MNININKFIENNTHIDKDEKAIVKFGNRYDDINNYGIYNSYYNISRSRNVKRRHYF